MYMGIVSMAKGHLSQGLKHMEEARKKYLDTPGSGFCALTEYALGKAYLQIVEGAESVSLPTMAKNIGFLVKTVPFAGRKAEEHFNKAIEVAREIGAKGTLGPAYLDLGALHRAKGRRDKARECFSTAIELFEQCQAETFLKQARESLASVQ
jgi:tetratricopeptide (TPR) repeat protein